MTIPSFVVQALHGHLAEGVEPHSTLSLNGSVVDQGGRTPTNTTTTTTTILVHMRHWSLFYGT